MKFNNLTYTMAFWLLRFWLAARAIGTGLTKFIGKVEGEIPNPAYEAKIKEAMADGLSRAEAADLVTDVPEKIQGTMDVISLASYHGLPAKGPMTVETFSASPLMPSFMVGPYAAVLGYALIVLGLTVLLGVCTRSSSWACSTSPSLGDSSSWNPRWAPARRRVSHTSASTFS